MITITLPELTESIEESAKAVCKACCAGVELIAPHYPEKPWVHVWPNDEWGVCSANDIRTTIRTSRA